MIACGGIENARVLLLSNQQRSSGVGNHSDLVGTSFKNTFGTPAVTSSLEPAILGSDITLVNGLMVISGCGLIWRCQVIKCESYKFRNFERRFDGICRASSRRRDKKENFY